MAAERFFNSELEDGVKKQYAGIGEMKIAHNPGLLMVMGIGSCIALALYDKYVKVGGMAHIMLPDSRGGRKAKKSCKFADEAVLILLEEMLRHDAKKMQIVAKIAGGASMFSVMDTLQIGEKNAAVVKEMLIEEGIKLVAEDVGGNYARSVILDTCTGEFTVKAKGGVKNL